MNNAEVTLNPCKTKYAWKKCTCELWGSACEACGPRYTVNGTMPYLELQERIEQEAINTAKTYKQMRLV